MFHATAWTTRATRAVSSLAPLLAITLAFFTQPGAARAQGGSHGSLVGNVTDQTGMPIKGVKISAKSPTQIGGSKVTYSNDEGYFRIVGLIPGTFEIIASAPQMRSVNQKDITVGINAPAEVNILMEVQTATEEVKVIEKAPIISTTTANVKEVYDEEFVDNLPIDTKTAGESFVGNNVPGAASSGTRTARIRGGSNEQTHMLVEGFYMNGQRSTMKGLAAMEVQTAGYGAENASTPGGVVNMVTKSGSNKFELDVNGYAEDNNLTFFRDNSDSNERDFYYLLNPNVSGPIIKDRLWFFVNFEGRRELARDEKDPAGFFPQTPDKHYGSFRGSGKLTWQISARNKLVSFTNFNRRYDMNTRRGYSPYVEPEAQRIVEDMDYFQGLIWESLLADNVFLKSQVGYQQFHNVTGPKRCKDDPIDCQHIPSILQDQSPDAVLQNHDDMSQEFQTAIQIANAIEWFPSSRAFGEHDIKLKNDYYRESEERYQSVPGDVRLRLNGSQYNRRTEYFSNDPRLEPARYGYFIRNSTGMKNVTSLSDAIRMTRYLTFNPGVAATYARAYNTNNGDTAYDGLAITPHVSFAWDATHDGRTVVRGSFNNYVDVNAQSLARHSLGDRVSRQCDWSSSARDFTSSCRYNGGSSSSTFGRPCGPTGVDVDGTDCTQKLKIPRTWEYTFGAEREIIQGVGIGTDLVYRLFTNPYEEYETNRIWNRSGTDLDPTGSFRDGRDHTVTDLSTLDTARRRYIGVTTSVKKREGALKLSLAYTWARQDGNVINGGNDEFGDIPPRDIYLYGPVSDDARHNIRGNVTYRWTNWLSTGFVWDYLSGRPYNRFYRNDETGEWEDLRAVTGTNPGSNLNSPHDDRPLKLPDIQKFNMQARVNLKPLIGADVEGYVDFLNILALRTTRSVRQNSDDRFGEQSNRMSPLKLRLGFRFKI